MFVSLVVDEILVGGFEWDENVLARGSLHGCLDVGSGVVILLFCLVHFEYFAGWERGEGFSEFENVSGSTVYSSGVGFLGRKAWCFCLLSQIVFIDFIQCLLMNIGRETGGNRRGDF